MELKVNEITLPEQIEFNYEELKTELQAKVKMYTSLVYTDEEIKQAKSDKANLNKLKKALNDERIRREKEYMQPFNDFKAKINEIIGIIDEPIKVIDTQVKEFEEKRKAEKESQIQDIFAGIEERPEWLQLEKIFNEKWLNASVSIKSISDELLAHVAQINSELNTLTSLQEFSFEAIDEYKRTLDINRAIAEGKRLADLQRAKQEAEERAKQEAEERAKAEAAKQEAPIIQGYVEEEEKPASQWVSFKALLNREQAIALKTFFMKNDIDYEQI